MNVVKEDVCKSAGSLQVCAGQDSGCEAAVHAMCMIFEDDDAECLLLVDATNAFNCLNRNAALHNAQIICPTIATALINTYRAEVMMFIIGGGILQSTEGTTQGDPLAMSTYAIGILPLINRLTQLCKQVCFADDATGAGSVENVKKWWDAIVKEGPRFGYHPNALKMWLIVKENKFEEVQCVFDGTCVQITTSGKRNLGAALGHPLFVNEYVDSKVKEWVSQIDKLSDIAITHPHAAYSAFTQGLVHRWSYIMRTVPNISDMLELLEEAICQRFLPSLTGQTVCGVDMRNLLSLPCNVGGLKIPNPSSIADFHFEASKHITAPLAALIIAQEQNYDLSTIETKQRKAEMKKEKKLLRKK